MRSEESDLEYMDHKSRHSGQCWLHGELYIGSEGATRKDKKNSRFTAKIDCPRK